MNIFFHLCVALTFPFLTSVASAQALPSQPEQGAQEFVPFDYFQLRGNLESGGLDEISKSDDVHLVGHAGFILNSCTELRFWSVLDFQLDTDEPKELYLNYEYHCNTPGVRLAIQGIDGVSGQRFDIIEYGGCTFGSQDAPAFFDQVITVDLTPFIDQIVAPGSALVTIQMGWGQASYTLVYPWGLKIDHIFLSK